MAFSSEKEVVLCTGPPLNGRDEYINEALKRATSYSYKYYHVYDYIESVASLDDVPIDRKTILDVAISSRDRMRSLRYKAFQEIISEIEKSKVPVHIVSTPSLFKWNGSRVEGFDEKIIKQLRPTKILILIDNILNVRQRIIHDSDWFPRFDSKEDRVRITKLAEWREDAITYVVDIVNKLLNNDELNINKKFYIIQFSVNHPYQTFIDLIFQDNSKKRIYLSYPMTGFESNKKVFDMVTKFANNLSEYFIVLDPGTIDDWLIVKKYDDQIATDPNAQVIKIPYTDPIANNTTTIHLDRSDIENATNILRKQIVERDFNMVRYSDAIVVYHHSDTISAGVMSEIAEAHKWRKPIYIYYPFSRRPSPFIEYFAKQNPSKVSLFSDETQLLNTLKEDQSHWAAYTAYSMDIIKKILSSH